MPGTILVPLDGSDLGERALPFAAALAYAVGGRLLLLHVTAADVSGKFAWADDPVGALNAVARRVRAGGLAVETVVYDATRAADAAGAIAQTAGRHRADFIAMATHGRGGVGRSVFGSVADAVLRQVDVPVLLVPAVGERGWPANAPRRVLVGLDGSQLSEAVLAPACRVAAALGAEIVLLRVVQPVTPAHDAGVTAVLLADLRSRIAAMRLELEETAGRLRAEGLPTRALVRSGDPCAEIVRVAHAEAASIIALATHGRRGLARLVLGSVATGVVRQADVPVLLVRPGAPEAQSGAGEGAVKATAELRSGVSAAADTPAPTGPRAEPGAAATK